MEKNYTTGLVKEKKDKFVRLPERAMYYLEYWKEESLVSGDDDISGVNFGRTIETVMWKSFYITCTT